MTQAELTKVIGSLVELRIRIGKALDAAIEQAGQIDVDDAEPCSTCGGEGTIPVLERHDGDNLPPGGVYLPSDETRPCPDCKLS